MITVCVLAVTLPDARRLPDPLIMTSHEAWSVYFPCPRRPPTDMEAYVEANPTSNRRHSTFTGEY